MNEDTKRVVARVYDKRTDKTLTTIGVNVPAEADDIDTYLAVGEVVINWCSRNGYAYTDEADYELL